MMKKPQKIKSLKGTGSALGDSHWAGYMFGRNETIDAYEKFLPRKKEIKKILSKYIHRDYNITDFIAQKILERLR